MSSRTPVRQQPLAKQVEEILLEKIRSGLYPPNAKLPPEHELAAELNVSRATVRTALGALATLGLVIRRHGAGTFVTQLPRISNPLDQAIDFQDLIARFDFHPSVEQTYCQVEVSTPEIARLLQIAPDASVLVSQKVFKADHKPMIYCSNSLSVDLLSPSLLEQVLAEPEIMEPIYHFLEDKLDLCVEQHVARLRPSLAKKCSFHPPLPLPGNTPILVIDEVAYTSDGRPVFRTIEYHPEKQMSFELIRRRVHS